MKTKRMKKTEKPDAFGFLLADGLHDGRNRLTERGRAAREAALAAMRADFIEGRIESGRVTLAALARKYGVPYGAACDAAARQGWKVEQTAAWGRWYLETMPHPYAPRDPAAASEVVKRAERAVAEWEEFQRVGYCEFHRRRGRWGAARPASPWAPGVRPDAIVLPFAPPPGQARDVGAPASVVDLAAFRAHQVLPFPFAPVQLAPPDRPAIAEARSPRLEGRRARRAARRCWLPRWNVRDDQPEPPKGA
jgi:hypothetical protein